MLGSFRSCAYVQISHTLHGITHAPGQCACLAGKVSAAGAVQVQKTCLAAPFRAVASSWRSNSQPYLELRLNCSCSSCRAQIYHHHASWGSHLPQACCVYQHQCRGVGRWFGIVRYKLQRVTECCADAAEVQICTSVLLKRLASPRLTRL